MTGVPQPQMRIGQVWRNSKQSGVIIYTYFCNWQNEPLDFCVTRVQGSVVLNTNDYDPAKMYEPIGTYAEVKDLMGSLLVKGTYSVSQPLMSLSEIETKVAENKDRLEESLRFIEGNAPIDKSIKRL
jgi:hypothetical protein